jgi:hypothetical protein
MGAVIHVAAGNVGSNTGYRLDNNCFLFLCTQNGRDERVVSVGQALGSIPV